MTITKQLAEALRTLTAAINYKVACSAANATAEKVAFADERVWAAVDDGTALLAAFDAQQAAPSEQPAPMPDRDAAIEVWHKHCNPFKSKVGHFPPSSVIDAMLEFAALASQPAARVALTWDKFVAACEAEYGEDFEPQVVSWATEEEKTQMLRVVRMVERAHGITAPAAGEKPHE